MLLAVDIGNTDVVWGLFAGDQLLHHWRTQTGRARTTEELAMLVDNLFRLAGRSYADCSGFVVASVVPQLKNALLELGARYLRCPTVFVGPDTTGGLRLDVDEPARVGADRIANAVAGWDRYRRALIVVDFGTATNFDVVDAHGAFVGGAIAPGVVISLDALFHRAAALPRIELARPPSPIGRDTITNMQAGVVFGVAGMVDGLVARIRREPGFADAPAIATGGLAPLLAPEMTSIDAIDPLLTLTGLRLIYERHRRV